MTLSTWLLYVAAVFVLTVTPGPSVLMCVSTSVNLGPRKAMVASLGSTVAIVGIMVLSALGLGAALAASETLFAVLKWLGAAYLAYLGITSLLSSNSEIAVSGSVESSAPVRLFAQGFLVGASNPGERQAQRCGLTRSPGNALSGDPAIGFQAADNAFVIRRRP